MARTLVADASAFRQKFHSQRIRGSDQTLSGAGANTTPMRILHLSYADAGGGAARAAYRLHAGLRKIGLNSRMQVMKRKSADPDVSEFKVAPDILSRVRRKMCQLAIEAPLRRFSGYDGEGFRRFSTERSRFGDELLRQLPPCDVLHLHWVAGMFDVPSLFLRLPPHLPVVWTLHDMNPMTGGCHYDDGCGRFVDRCGRCPHLASSRDNDPSRESLEKKRAAFRAIAAERLSIAAPSAWMAGQARASSLLQRFRIETIPYGLDTHDFAPRDQRYAREVLGIPADMPVLLFVAATVNDPRKGFRYVKEAVEKLGSPVFLLSVGGSTVERTEHSFHLGNVDADPLLSLVYSSADAFVVSSLEDNLPLTVLESLACGTPVVGFQTGGIPDAVQEGITGQTVPTGDVAALAAAIGKILESGRRSSLRADCREAVMQNYSLEIQARTYLRLYEQVAATAV